MDLYIRRVFVPTSLHMTDRYSGIYGDALQQGGQSRSTRPGLKYIIGNI
jgi:hypothetical protein